jgi:mannonate dehydratase
MYQATRVLEEVGYNGVMIPDHIPEMAGDGRIGYAYSIAYMKAHVDRARAEVALWK